MPQREEEKKKRKEEGKDRMDVNKSPVRLDIKRKAGGEERRGRKATTGSGSARSIRCEGKRGGKERKE